MTNTPTLDVARALAPLVSDLGGRFMLDGDSFTAGAELGYTPGYAYYLAGRFGVLGRCPADMVAAAAVFWSPELVEREWLVALATADPQTTAEHYFDVCARYARKHYSASDGFDRLVALGERVVDEASSAGQPIFAGLRALPRADDSVGRGGQVLTLMREYHFGLHAQCVLAAGLDPQLSVLATGGAGNAAMFGWAEPYPAITDDMAALRHQVEEQTHARSADSLGVLDAGELIELQALVAAVAAAAT